MHLIILIVWIGVLVWLVKKFGFKKTWGCLTVFVLSLFLLCGLLSCLGK